MKLTVPTKDNYYSNKLGRQYFSASQIKSFMDCPARTLASIKGKYERPMTSALMIGQYIDTYLTEPENIDTFLSDNHDAIYKVKKEPKGKIAVVNKPSEKDELRSDFVKANEMIARAKQSKLFMKYLDGDHQAIFVGGIFGYPFKAKFDVYVPGERIVDLKTSKDMQPMYKAEQGKISFAEYWNWTLQMAIYQAIEGHKLPVYLAVITKENPPDIAIIQIPQSYLDAELEILQDKLPLYDAIKRGIVKPDRCGQCDYCRATHKLDRPVMLDELNDF